MIDDAALCPACSSLWDGEHCPSCCAPCYLVTGGVQRCTWCGFTELPERISFPRGARLRLVVDIETGSWL